MKIQNIIFWCKENQRVWQDFWGEIFRRIRIQPADNSFGFMVCGFILIFRIHPVHRKYRAGVPVEKNETDLSLMRGLPYNQG
jgi:hypothetical protein